MILRLCNDAEVMIMNDKDDTAVKEVRSVIGQWCQEEFQVLFQCQFRDKQDVFHARKHLRK